jgi:acyl-CoA synthetase (AMP-forming)/AMP-acid ligase II
VSKAIPDGVDNRLVVGGVDLTWRRLPALPLPSPAAALVENGFAALSAVKRHTVEQTELLVAASSRVDTALRAELRADGFALVAPAAATAVAPTTPREPERGRVWLLTSGSTGRPKRIGHTLASLTTVRGAQPPRTWLCAYSPGTYAWWQVVTLSLTCPDQHLVVVEPDELESWPGVAAARGVTAVSGTPTFWRRALHRDPDALAAVPLEQITLGGEPVDQAILDRLRAMFPQARVSWIYASSEVGASIVVHDGRAGFPVEWLDRAAPDRPTLSLAGDELVVESPYAGAGLAGVVRTGDRAGVVDDRVVITGRLDSDEINVGGAKVSAGAVREILTAHPDVVWARVAARKAPIVGQLVGAEIVLRPAAEADTEALTRWCSVRLPDYAVPRMIRVLDAIPARETLKSDL